MISKDAMQKLQSEKQTLVIHDPWATDLTVWSV